MDAISRYLDYVHTSIESLQVEKNLSVIGKKDFYKCNFIALQENENQYKVIKDRDCANRLLNLKQILLIVNKKKKNNKETLIMDIKSYREVFEFNITN